MRRPKKILVPVDFSDFSREAIQTGSDYAELFSAELILSHVCAPPLYPEGMGFGSPPATDIADELGERLRAIGEETIPPAVKWEHHVWTGTPYAVIVEQAKVLDVDMIVMPTHGRTGLSKMFIGSTAERVVRKAPCQVLVLHCGSGT